MTYIHALALKSSWKHISLFLLLLLTGLGIITCADYGICWDYETLDSYGKQVWSWYFEPSKDSAVINDSMKFYGPAFEIFVNAMRSFIPEDPAVLKTMLTFFTALTGAYASYIITSTLAGARAGFLAALLLMLIPMYYGHGFINPKDTPFAALYVLCLAVIIVNEKETHLVNLSRLLKLSILMGLALSIRIGAVFIIPLIAFAWLHPAIINNHRIAFSFKILTRNVLLIILAVLLAWLVMMLTWPYILLNPVSGPVDVLKTSSLYPWDFTVLYAGKFYLANQLPDSYLFVWFLKTLPELHLFLLAAGLTLVFVKLFKKPAIILSTKALNIILIILSILIPIAAILAAGSTLYDAVRHLLFIVPSLAILAALTLDYFLKILPSLYSRIAAIATFLSMLPIVLDLISLHPYQYVYFNKLFAGGLKSAYGQFETEYWATCMKESVSWVYQNIPEQKDKQIKIASWSDPQQVREYMQKFNVNRKDIQFTTQEAEADIYLTTSRFNAHIVRPYKLLHTVSRQEVPLCFIFDRNSK